MQIKAVWRISAAALLAFVAVGRAYAFSVAYDQKMTNNGKTIQSKVQLKDAQFRMESVIDGMETVTVRNGSGVYSYIPSQNLAIQLPDINSTDAATQPSANYMDYLQKNNARLIRSESINGYACDVYEFLDPQTNGKTTAWIWKDGRFPVKFVLETSQGLITSELTNVVLNAPVSDAAFALPADVKITQMSQFMQGMGGLLPGLSGAPSVATGNAGATASQMQQAVQQLTGQTENPSVSSEAEGGTVSDPALQQLMKQLGEQLGATSHKSQ